MRDNEMASFAWAGFVKLRGKCKCWLVHLILLLQPCVERMECYMTYLASITAS